MKRTEIVLLIAESLIEPRFPEDPTKEAEHILKRLEKRGMRPPAFRDGREQGFAMVSDWEKE